MKHKFFIVALVLTGFACKVEAGTSSSKFDNQIENFVDLAHPDLVDFTQKHIADQKIKAKMSDALQQDVVWKNKKPYSHCRTNQKIMYKDLPDVLHDVIREYMGINAPMKKPNNYYSILQKAVNDCDGDRVQILLALGADVNLTPAESGRTPLYVAIEVYNSVIMLYEDYSRAAKVYAIFRYLLAKGADYNKPNEKKDDDSLLDGGKTPLYAAVDCRHARQILQDLLKLPDINLDVKNRWGRTALDEAKNNAMSDMSIEFRKYNYRVCALLEQAGAPSSVILAPMPSDEIMRYENRCARARYERESRGFLDFSWMFA